MLFSQYHFSVYLKSFVWPPCECGNWEKVSVQTEAIWNADACGSNLVLQRSKEKWFSSRLSFFLILFVELDCGSEVEEGSLPLCSDLEQSVNLVVDV
jgi:hypothetical protein